MARAIVAAALIIMFPGCATLPPRSAPLSTRDAVTVVIFQELLKFPVAQKQRNVIVCIRGANGDESPPPLVLRQVSALNSHVVSCAERLWEPGDVVMWVNRPNDVGTTQRVRAGYACGELCMDEAIYVVTKREGKWIVVGLEDEIAS